MKATYTLLVAASLFCRTASAGEQDPAPTKPMKAEFSIYSGDMGDERAPTITDRKLAVEVTGQTARPCAAAGFSGWPHQQHRRHAGARRRRRPRCAPVRRPGAANGNAGALDCIGMRRGLWDGGRPGQQAAGMLPERSPAAGGGSAGAGLDFGSGKWPGGKAAARAAALIISRNFN
jgi:hypothetical protein